MTPVRPLSVKTSLREPAGFRLPLTLDEGRTLFEKRSATMSASRPNTCINLDTQCRSILRDNNHQAISSSEATLATRVATLNALIEAIEYSKAIYVHYDYSAAARAGGAIDLLRVKQAVVKAAGALGLRRSVVQTLQSCSPETLTNEWLLTVVIDGWYRPPSPLPRPEEASAKSLYPGSEAAEPTVETQTVRKPRVSQSIERTRGFCCCRCM
jgi:hypothetical protein